MCHRTPLLACILYCTLLTLDPIVLYRVTLSQALKELICAAENKVKIFNLVRIVFFLTFLI